MLGVDEDDVRSRMEATPLPEPEFVVAREQLLQQLDGFGVDVPGLRVCVANY
jgi:hypothetical protein